jgi:acyl-CoA synthetase (NDP forming)
VLKVGRSERTQRAITSHTGGLAGSSRVFSEVLRAHRAIEVSDLDELTEVLAVCQGRRWPRGRGISVISGSGGLAELILDNATAAGLELPPLSPAERAEAERVIGRITGDGNPFDAWGNGNYAVNLPHAMSVVDGSERIAAIVYCADTSNDGHIGHPGRILDNVKMLAAAAEKSSKPYYLMSSRLGVMNQQQVKALRECGLVQIGGTRQGLGAIDRVGRYMMEPPPPLAPAVKRRAALRDLLAANSSRRVLNELDAKQLLAEHGLPVTREHRVATLAEAMTAARKIGYPVVLKGLSDDIPHKTELGLVAVALADEKRLADAFANLRECMAGIEPPPREAAFLVQELVTDGIEVFAGISRDPDFGLALAFGMGGTGIEVTRDFALRMLPLREGDAQAMIAETRGAALLAAVRGRPAADVASLACCLMALADFAQQNAGLIDEIDLNPIMVLPEGRGCIVADALIIVRAHPKAHQA